MERSEDINELAAALSKAQGEMKAVKKSASGQVGKVKTKYATLDSVIDTIRKPLADNELSFTQLLDGDNLITMLMHSSGQWFSSSAQLSQMARNSSAISDVQVLGGSLTYMKRYMLGAMLGVSSEEDNDGKKTNTRKQSPPKQEQPESEQSGAAVWMADNSTRAKFWIWANEQGLDHDQVHIACNVQSMKDFPGTKADAVEMIKAFAAGMTGASAPFEEPTE